MSTELEQKQARINGANSAFGFVDNRSNSYEDNEVYYGLTKREYFAAMAGDPPSWFVHEPLPKNIKPIPDWENVMHEEDKKIVIDWLHDGIYDLPDHLQWFQDAHAKYDQELNDWSKRNAISRYFQWKTFYADNLLNQLNQK